MKINKYFHGLDALRGFAAIAILIHHVEQFKLLAELSNFFSLTPIQTIGRKGVSMFLILSGFLISYKLISELEITGKINIRSFYLKRMGRIFPLYFLVVFFSFFILPHIINLQDFNNSLFQNFWKSLSYYIFLLPHIAYKNMPIVSGASQTWVVGLLLEFYLIIPLLIKTLKKKLIIFSLSVVIIKFFFDIFYQMINFNFHSSSLFIRVILFLGSYLNVFLVEDLAMGIFLAALIFNKKTRLNSFLLQPYVLIISSIYLLLSFFVVINPAVERALNAICLTIVIANIMLHPEFMSVKIPHIFNSLGKVSYAIYMYHPILIVLLISLIKNFVDPTKYGFLFNSLLYPIVLLSTVFISILSGKYFESLFLREKRKI